ncbi:hypothetical protein SAMN04488498_13617 [Mesorhizobium albiziae]|uniref:Uncharacterized protein n=1 Tax=Neomesorhizobium albiziae TaxID=335020 RepID=A0A1I4F831_9HYPH|nr:hypothetical protein [Mesorhizobium albiziae]GLS30835.1 hypothetical protein GCM10007937_25440 [Mesorhizobium albiziae]SFL12571.1 hypothetical protein SAMN04488498_13617 [Mesorhizobium albiziae]
MSVVTRSECSALPAGMAAAPWCAHLGDIERFSQMLHETNLNACGSFDDAPGKGPGNYELESAEHGSEAPTGQNLLYFLGATLLGGAILKTSIEIQEATEQGTAPRSAELAELAEAIADRISVGRDNVGDSTVQIVLHGELLGDTRVTISYRHDTLRIFIESERLWPILQFQGHAFARDLSNRLGMRVAVTVGAHSSTPEEQDNNGGSRGLEPVLHHIAEKGT